MPDCFSAHPLSWVLKLIRISAPFDMMLMMSFSFFFGLLLEINLHFHFTSADSHSVAEHSSSDFDWKVPQIPLGSWLLFQPNKYQSKQLLVGMGEERTSHIFCLKIQAVDIWGKSTSSTWKNNPPNSQIFWAASDLFEKMWWRKKRTTVKAKTGRWILHYLSEYEYS